MNDVIKVIKEGACNKIERERKTNLSKICMCRLTIIIGIADNSIEIDKEKEIFTEIFTTLHPPYTHITPFYST